MRADGPVNECTACLPAALGRAFDQANMPDSAIAYFETYLATPALDRTVMDRDPMLLAGVYRRLGELYEARGDRMKAVAYDTRFIDLWKAADPELQPELREVRARLARLTDLERRRG
jgi:tetratricopeptide (TPR) repeat protein